MTDDSHTVLCGKCEVPLDGPSGGNDEDMFTCPSCGRSDNRKNVLRIVSKYVEEITARALQESLRKSMRSNKFVKLGGKPIPKRSHKFVVDYEFRF